MTRANELGLPDDDLANIKIVMDDLIDVVAAFQGAEEHNDSHYSALLSALDFAKFVVGGIIYSNGLHLGDCEHEEDEDEDDQ